MKTLAVTLATLMISGLASAADWSHSSDWNQKSNSPARSGSSTVSSAIVPPGNTMNDHDKMLEMCRSLRTDRSCDEIMRECENQVDRQTCMHNFSRK